MRLVTAGTEITNLEIEYVTEAVKQLGDPVHFNDYLKKFEKEFAIYVGSKYALTTSSGTGALHLAVASLGVGKRDEVIMPDMTFVACANVVSYSGGIPVLVDIKNDIWTIDPDKVEEAITSFTKVIMPVYTYGKSPDMERILSIAKKNNCYVVEDACPAIGTRIKGKHAGTFGEFGCFSFQGAKTLAIGIGGMLVTDNEDLYKEAKLLRDHYQTTPDFWHEKIGFNYCMSNIQAAVGLAQLCHVDDMIMKKHKIHDWYGNIVGQEFDEESTPWMNSVKFNNRNVMRKYLFNKGIDTRSTYPQISTFPMFEQRFKNPVSKVISEMGTNIPSKVTLTQEDIKEVKEAIRNYER